MNTHEKLVWNKNSESGNNYDGNDYTDYDKNSGNLNTFFNKLFILNIIVSCLFL